MNQPKPIYISTKRYGHEEGLSCAFRQWRAESHCKYLHGYAIAITLEFHSHELDVRNWVVDFGSLKSLKSTFKENLDHKTIVAADDPHLEEFKKLHDLGLIQLNVFEHVGCEALAELIFGVTDSWLASAGYAPRVWLHKVIIEEHGANSAQYTLPKEGYP